jgi:hypothetical protein
MRTGNIYTDYNYRNEVKFTPIGEVFLRGKLYLDLGTEFPGDNGKDLTEYYDVEKERIIIRYHIEKDGQSLVKIGRDVFSWMTRIPPSGQYLSKFDKAFMKRDQAKNHGIRPGSELRIIKRWSDNWALIRDPFGTYRNVFRQYLDEITQTDLFGNK